MADEINKKITVSIEAPTEKLQQNITSLSAIIDKLSESQQKLSKSGDENSAAFKTISQSITRYQGQLKAAGQQLNTLSSALKSSSATLRQNKTLVDALNKTNDQLTESVRSGAEQLKKLSSAGNTVVKTSQRQQGALIKAKQGIDAHAKSMTDSSSKSNQLKNNIDASAKSLQNQDAKIKNSKKAVDEHGWSMATNASKAAQLKTGVSKSVTGFQQQQAQVEKTTQALDVHQLTMQALETEFDKIKGVSGEFGPSLEDAAQGFNFLKNGLDLTQDGFKGVGVAIRETGFGFLVQLLQQVFEYFTQTTEGGKMLKGAISAIGVIVNSVKKVFGDFKKAIIDAITHPIESIKELGRIIVENIINRFKAFSIILNGIIHLNFKEMTDGAIQAFTGVADATNKIGTAFTTVQEGVKKTAGEMEQAYKEGSAEAIGHIAEHEQAAVASVDRQIQKYRELSAAIAGVDEKMRKRNKGANSKGKPEWRTDNDPEPLMVKGAGIEGLNTNDMGNVKVTAKDLTHQKKTENAIVTIKQNALKTIEEYAKQSAGKIATDAFGILTQSIKQQSNAKVAALEKDKQAELNNSSLTSAQKLAIQQKFKQQEAQVKIKEFKEEQEASIAQAVINGALAITKGTAQTGVLATLYIPTIIAETAVQIAKIAAQKPPAYASGGLHYASDGKGGVLSGYSKTDNTNAWLRSGEGVVVSEAMRVPWARNLVSAINVGFGGRDFSIANPGRGYAVGGIFTDGGEANRYYNQPVHDQKNLANSIAYQMINNFPPVYVDVKDINNQQNILAQTINRVNL
jgi:hypothetical protein